MLFRGFVRSGTRIGLEHSYSCNAKMCEAFANCIAGSLQHLKFAWQAWHQLQDACWPGLSLMQPSLP